MNRVAQGNFEQCEMGQLLAYLFGAIIDSIQNGKTLHRLLGIFIEGRKVCISCYYFYDELVDTTFMMNKSLTHLRDHLFRKLVKRQERMKAYTFFKQLLLVSRVKCSSRC